jgi:hypothetical protein
VYKIDFAEIFEELGYSALTQKTKAGEEMW